MRNLDFGSLKVDLDWLTGPHPVQSHHKPCRVLDVIYVPLEAAPLVYLADLAPVLRPFLAIPTQLVILTPAKVRVRGRNLLSKLYNK